MIIVYLFFIILSMNKLSVFKIIIRTVIISILVIYFGCMTLLSIPSVQRGLGRLVTHELQDILQTEVQIGNIELGLFNRIIIQDVLVKDRENQPMLRVARFSAKFDIGALFDGQIRIQNVQLLGAAVHLSKKDPKSDPNFRFVIDAFTSKKKKKTNNFIDLRINALLIRRGQLNYDVYSEPSTPGKFNTSHVAIDNLSAKISLKALTADSLNVQVGRLSFVEQSGFQVKKMILKAVADEKLCKLSETEITFSRGSIKIDSLTATYDGLFAHADSTFFNYNGGLKARLVPADFSSFAPALKHFEDTVSVDMSFHNKGDVHKLSDFRVYSPHKEVLLLAQGYFVPPTDSLPFKVNGTIRQAEITQEGFQWIFHNISGKDEIPAVLQRIGTGLVNAEVKGNADKLETKLMLHTALGIVQGEVDMFSDAKTQHRSYSGQLFTEAFDLGTLLGNNKTFGNTSFNLDFNGLKYQNQGLESYIKGTVYEFEYQGYKYHNILLDGDFKPGDFNGRIALEDPNAFVAIDGKFSTSGKTPVFDLNASLKDFRPEQLHLTDKYPGTSFSGKLTAKFTGSNIDDVLGMVRVDSLQSQAPEEEYSYTLPYFSIEAQSLSKGKEIAIHSPFLNASIRGDLSYRSVVPSIGKVVSRYMPALTWGSNTNVSGENNFKFRIHVDNTTALKRIFRLPVDLEMPAKLDGWFNDQNERMFVIANAPQFSVNENKYESVHLVLENPEDALRCKARGNLLMNKGSMMNLSLDTKAKEDCLYTTLHWGNNTDVTYSGKVMAFTTFSRDVDSRKLHTEIDLQPGHFILNDTVWSIYPSKIKIDKDSIDIRDFHFEHANQYIRINGRLGKGATDRCKVDLKDINLLYIMDMIQFEAVKFEGAASGTVYLDHVLKEPQLDAHLDVKNFMLNDALLGRAAIHGGFDNENGRILLDADIREDTVRYTRVKGYVSPKEKGLDLNIDAGGTNLAFLGKFVQGIFTDMQGRAHGNVRLYGPFKGLDLEGDIRANLGMTVDALNTRFNAQSDSVRIRSGEFLFNNVHLADLQGNKGMVNGYLRHKKLKDLTYNFRFNADHMLIFHTDEDDTDYPFYGKIYATGTAIVQGNPQNGLFVEGNLQAEDKTSFVYVLGAAAEATNDQFITFVDRTPKRAHEEIETEVYHYLNKKEQEEVEEDPADIRLNLQIEPTPLAEMRILMDPVAGDYISAKGKGNLSVHFFNKGDFQIFGNYNIAEGIYKISMQNVIRKDFVLRPGGTVSFNGDPRAANLNLQAAHTVPSASLNDLIPDASSSRGNVRVNCIVNLSGNLTSPNMSFDLELPTVNEEDRQLVRSLTSTPEQMTTQIIYLLGVGKFYAFDYANQTTQSNATSSLAFNTLSGQLNNMLSQVIDNQNWNLGTNLSTGQNGWTDVEAEAILSGRLLNNRLIINGNFGYRENTLQNSNFVGDFEAVWLLTENGDFRLRGYNMTNDRYFTKSTMTTQGIGFIYKKDFTRWGELADWFANFKKYRKEKLRKKKEAASAKRASAAKKRSE